MKKVCILILIGLVLVGCVAQPSKNLSFFDNPICQPPCWQNIIPGISTKDDALIILSKINFIDKPVIDPHYPNIGFDDTIHFSAYEGKDNSVDGWIDILGDRVIMISFNSNFGTIQHIIRLFGVPQSILTIHGSYMDQVTLLSSSKGIAFGYGLASSKRLDSSDIRPDTEIVEVILFDPNHYQQVLDSKALSAGALNGDEIRDNLRPWNGYGSFKDKYWPPATPATQ